MFILKLLENHEKITDRFSSTAAICKVGDYGEIHYQVTQHLMRATTHE